MCVVDVQRADRTRVIVLIGIGDEDRGDVQIARILRHTEIEKIEVNVLKRPRKTKEFDSIAMIFGSLTSGNALACRRCRSDRSGKFYEDEEKISSICSSTFH